MRKAQKIGKGGKTVDEIDTRSHCIFVGTNHNFEPRGYHVSKQHQLEQQQQQQQKQQQD